MMADSLNFRDLVADREDRGGDARPSPPSTLETPRVEPEDRFDWCPPTPLAFGPPSPVFLKCILPENPGFDDCKDPEKDDGLNFKKPESPGFDDDSDKNLNFEKPGFDKDDNCKDQDKSLNFEKPETLNSEKPETLNSEKPETLNSEKPETLNSEKPETLNSEKPETLNSEKPESLNFEKAESSGESFKKPEILDENLKSKLNKSEFEKVFGDVILVCSRPDLKRPVEPENCLTERKKCKRSEKKDECLPKIRCDLPKPGKPGPKKLPGLEKKIKDLSNKPGSDLLKPGKPGSENKDLPRLPRLEKKIKDGLSKPRPENKDLPHKKLPVSEKKKDLAHKKLPDLPKPGKPSPEKKNKDKKLPGLEKKNLPKPGPEKKNKDKKLPGPDLSKPSPEKKNKDKKLPGPDLSKPGKPSPEKKNKDKKLPRLEKKIKDLSGSEKKKRLHESSHKKLPGPEKKKLPEKPEKKNKLCKLVFEKKQKFKSVLFLKLFEMSNASERRKIFEKSGVIGSGTSLKNFKIPKYKDHFGENDVVCLFPEAEEYKYVYDLNEKQYRDFLEDYRKQLENVKI